MRNPRWFPDNTTHLITNRIHRKAQRLAPGPIINEILVRHLCLAAQKYHIKLLGYVIMSNHFHLIAHVGPDSPQEAMSDFMCMFQSRVATAVNTLQRKKGHFWQGRYHAVRLLDIEAVVRSLYYVIYNPVKAGLVKEPSEWTGVLSHHEAVSHEGFQQGMHPDTVSYGGFVPQSHALKAVDREAWRKAGCPTDTKPFVRDYTLKPASLCEVFGQGEGTCLQSLSVKVIQQHQMQLEDWREQVPSGKNIKGRNALKPWWIGRVPDIAWEKLSDEQCEALDEKMAEHKTQSDKAKPYLERKRGGGLCHGTTHEAILSYLRELHVFMECYRRASERYRDGDIGVKFPHGSCAPARFPRAMY